MDDPENERRTPSRTSMTSKSSVASASSSSASKTEPPPPTKPAPAPAPRSRSRKQSLQYARSNPSDVEDKSLTSFPSLSPESPRTPKKMFAASPLQAPGAFGSGLPSPPLKDASKSRERSRSQRGGEEVVPTPVTAWRQRPSIVEALTKHSPSFRASGRRALFDESPTSSTMTGNASIPGNIHATDDAHIERLIARTGAVALVRQLAEDLALREMEVGTIRRTAEARERELKRMLRETEVSSLDIEKRLRQLDHSGILRTDGSAEEGNGSGLRSQLGDLMREALGEEMGASGQLNENMGDPHATIRGNQAPDAEGDSRRSSVGGENTKNKGWKDYLWSSNKEGQPKGSSDDPAGVSDGGAPAARRPGIDEDLFQPRRPSDDATAADDAESTASTRERISGSTSWTRTLFGGKTQSQRGDAASVGKGPSDESSKSSTRATSQSSMNRTSSAQAALLKVKDSNAPRRKAPAPLTAGPLAATKHVASSSQSLPPGSPASFQDPASYGPVEMDAILPAGTRPPTLSPTVQNLDDPSEPLTDRFGFIYDQRRRKKEADAFARMSVSKGKPRVETLGTSKDGNVASSVEEAIPDRPPSPASTNSRGDGWRWQDYLKIATFPTELLAHTPASNNNLLTLGNAEMQESLKRSGGVDDAANSTPSQSAPSAAAVTAENAEIVSPSGPIPVDGMTRDRATSNPSDPEPVKLLLAQLTELHDTLQRDKEFKWNEFLRKVRAERRKAGEAAQAAQAELRPGASGTDTPEAAIADGEMVGIATLGHKGKVGRAKYKEFKTLVLGGIPVSYRAKIWAECSGAVSLRVPRYYDDLVAGTGGAATKANDPAVITQIDVDIHRTLTDNVFFRTGPGVPKLSEVLRAYARHNPEVGYCQGMNLIAASLLLIMPTAEDAFWVMASIIEHILPRHYYDHSLLTSRADQQVLRQYVSELLPKLSGHLESLSIDLEALTFQWFLSLFTACLSAEALYRVWDVLLCSKDEEGHGGSTFLFQVALALLKLNEPALLACQGPAEVYAYLGDSITNHAISIDGLIAASDGLRAVVCRADVEERRAYYVEVERETMRERERIRRGTISGGGPKDELNYEQEETPQPLQVES